MCWRDSGRVGARACIDAALDRCDPRIASQEARDYRLQLLNIFELLGSAPKSAWRSACWRYARVVEQICAVGAKTLRQARFLAPSKSCFGSFSGAHITYIAFKSAQPELRLTSTIARCVSLRGLRNDQTNSTD